MEADLEQLPLVKCVSTSIEFTGKGCPCDMPLGFEDPFDQVTLDVTDLRALVHSSTGTALNSLLSAAAPKCEHASDTESCVFVRLEGAVCEQHE